MGERQFFIKLSVNLEFRKNLLTLRKFDEEERILRYALRSVLVRSQTSCCKTIKLIMDAKGTNVNLSTSLRVWRLTFNKRYQNWTIQLWSTALFSDASSVQQLFVHVIGVRCPIQKKWWQMYDFICETSYKPDDMRYNLCDWYCCSTT